MFTGITRLGKVAGVKSSGFGLALAIDLGGHGKGINRGDSIAINGVCLTVEGMQGSMAEFAVIPESVERSNLGRLRIGESVNVELAMRAGDRLDGHIVQGHADGIGTICQRADGGGKSRVQIECDRELLELMVMKGSVAVDGVSLTVSELGQRWFWVDLIPHTLENTTLGKKAAGEKVNLEADVIGKYVRRFLELEKTSHVQDKKQGQGDKKAKL